MTREELEKQKEWIRITEESIVDAKRKVALVEAALDKDDDTPLGEQVWVVSPVSGGLPGLIYREDGLALGEEPIATVYTIEARRIILAVPALVKAVEEHIAAPVNAGRDPLRKALKAMIGE